MPIEKQMTPFIDPDDVDADEEGEVEVEVINPDAVIIDDGEEQLAMDFMEDGGGSHDENLADRMDEEDLSLLALDLLDGFEADKRSRKEWADAYVKGLDLLGMKVEDRSEPWPGAAGMYHPLLTESVVRFQAQAMGELCPASGPAQFKVMGKMTPEKIKQGKRVQSELNFLITEEMYEYRDEMEQLLFRTALAGSGFKKVYYDPAFDRPCAMFVPAEDFIVTYGASDLRTTDRFTHVMKKTEIELRKLQFNGFYRDIDLPEPTPDMSDVQEKYDKLQGQEAVIEDDDRYTLLEMHVMYDLPGQFADPDGLARPYIITIDKSSATVLSIRRNWYEDDPLMQRRMHFAHYKYLPGMGFYGLGLIHMIGGLAKSATSILRQLVDAGTLSNLPAGFKARGARIKGDSTPLLPGEFRDIDVPGGAIRDALFPLPRNEPSPVLYQLLGTIVEEGRRIGSIADIDVGDMNAQAPVGTTLALLERSLKVMSGVQARMHASMRNELRLIARCVHDYMGPEYSYYPEEDYNRTEDFDGRVDIIPVSDPNAATMAQRVTQYQAALQLAQSAPHLYDMGKLHRQMLEVLNIQEADEIVKLEDDIKAKDPVSENMCILKQEPVKVFSYQDHEAHIQTHMAAAQDPKIQQLIGQSPFAQAIQSAMAAHITEHVAAQYRVEIMKQLGVEIPELDDDDEPLPPEIEKEVSRMAAQAAAKLLQKDQAEMAEKARQEEEKDPLTIIQRMELEIKQAEQKLKEAKAKHDAVMDLERLKLEEKVKLRGLDIQDERIDSEDRRAGAQVAAKMATDLDTNMRQERMKGAELGIRIAEDIDKSAMEDKKLREQAEARRQQQQTKPKGDSE